VVVAFDPGADLALVRTDLQRRPLSLAEPRVGDQGVVMGFPGGGPFDPSPFRVGELLSARGLDIYDARTVDRQILALAAALEPGDSGSAVLRADGAVVGVAVAVAPDRPDVGYALNTSELRELLAAPTDGRVSTGPCTT
jgi:S1-C subfamily serine protease